MIPREDLKNLIDKIYDRFKEVDSNIEKKESLYDDSLPHTGEVTLLSLHNEFKKYRSLLKLINDLSNDIENYEIKSDTIIRENGN